MQLRDRRGPFAAFLLAIAYVLLVIFAIELVLAYTRLLAIPPLSSAMRTLLWLNLVALGWRLAARALFTAREFGLVEGLLAIPRVVISNTVAIVAARRAVFCYARSLKGAVPTWDKTSHTLHPAHYQVLATERAS